MRPTSSDGGSARVNDSPKRLVSIRHSSQTQRDLTRSPLNYQETTSVRIDRHIPIHIPGKLALTVYSDRSSYCFLYSTNLFGRPPGEQLSRHLHGLVASTNHSDSVVRKTYYLCRASGSDMNESQSRVSLPCRSYPTGLYNQDQYDELEHQRRNETIL
jgi:hypothetical protein